LMDSLKIPQEIREDFWEMVHENISSRSQAIDWWRVCSEGVTPIVAAEDDDFIKAAFNDLPSRPWTKATWSDWTTYLKEKTGRKGKSLFKPLRLAMTGQSSGPDMGLLMPLLQNDPKI